MESIPSSAPTDAKASNPASPSHGASGAPLSAELEREIADAMADMSAAMDIGSPRAKPAPGAKPAIRGPRVIQGGREHRKGKVVSVGPSDIFIEFGPKELGVAPRAGWTDENLPKVGDELEVVIDRFEPDESLFLCSAPGAVQKADWEMLTPGQVVEARVTGVNKGGLELEVAHHRAFMPASQVDVHHVADLSVYVGQKMACEVQRIDRTGRGNIVLSRRNILEQQRAETASKLKEQLKEGDVRDGVVRKLMPFGAFVDLGGIDGLLHISDMSYERVNKPEDVVKEGQQVTVKVLKINWDEKRLSLGLKQVQGDPFQKAAEAIAAGAEVSGRVTKIMDFGAFVEVAPGVEGLVHISELDWKRVGKVSDVVRQDQVVKVKVLEVDPGKRRVSLSIKQTTEPPAGPAGRPGRGESRSIDDIKKETPEFRRLREKFMQQQKAKGPLKGGF
ncbi:MAG: S1 RNA-binding domain-containing protein [Phycisphaerales bacterium]|nr:S1 RNA-binding domain-containing protein [Phycisphaerales bacterium]